MRSALWALSCGAIFLLFIAGVNVTHLFLALALARRKESAVRRALGGVALAVSRLLQRLLFDVSVNDPLTYLRLQPRCSLPA